MACLFDIAILSIFIGNWLALKEQNVNGILAYLSIAHLEYLLVAFFAESTVGNQAAVFYFVVYFISMLGSFAQEKDAEGMGNYQGLI